jgi:hypothetical protein
VSPARGSRPRAALLSQPPGAGQPATRRTCTLTRPPLLPHSDSRGAGRVSRKARRTASGQPPQLDSNGVPSPWTASVRPIVPAAGRGHELPVETPILLGPHSSCADSDWACHTGHPAPTTSDARTCSRHGPQNTRAHAPAGHDRSGCTSLRPAGTYPRAKNVHGLDDPGITSCLQRPAGSHILPLTPSRAAHLAFNAQPGRSPRL